MQVTIPDPAIQHRKTPAKIRVFETIKTPRSNTESFTGDGTSDSFTLQHTPSSIESVTVDMEEAAYSLSDSTVQLEKAPSDGSSIIVEYTYIEVTERPRWKKLIEGSGEEGKIVKINELLDKFPDTATPIGPYKDLYELIAGELYEESGYPNSGKGVLAALLDLFGNPVENYDSLTTKEVRSLWFEHQKVEEPRWGLGCPHGCGRSWEFKPDGKGGFIPVDESARTGLQAEILDEWDSTNPETGETTHYYKIRHWEGDVKVVTEVPINRGYLNWKDGKFICDNCGGEIEFR